tara:strand:- start:1783 stop:2040 length:258 start_codon:yes stop_codon:yes gene_type:complete
MSGTPPTHAGPAPAIKRRNVTSAVPNMTVANVRKALAALRQDWKNQSWEAPFDPTTVVHEDMTYERFAYNFLLGHHMKRHQKSKK